MSHYAKGNYWGRRAIRVVVPDAQWSLGGDRQWVSGGGDGDPGLRPEMSEPLRARQSCAAAPDYFRLQGQQHLAMARLRASDDVAFANCLALGCRGVAAVWQRRGHAALRVVPRSIM